MPELPEVETIRRDLKKMVVGKILEKIEVFEPRLLQNCTKEELQASLQNTPLKAMERRGKFLIFNFGQQSAVVHLRMSGWFSDEPGKHTRMIMHFNDKTLYFDDTRRFGTLHFLPTDERESHDPLKKLGLEPLGETFTKKDFQTVLNSSREIKKVLLDQTKVTGIGNIYACEALYQSRIHPMKPTDEISSVKVGKLHQAIQQILQRAIDNHGSTLGDSVGDYRTLDGAQGNFQDHFQVYGRHGDGCFHCGKTIERITQGGRSTFFCPSCQKK